MQGACKGWWDLGCDVNTLWRTCRWQAEAGRMRYQDLSYVVQITQWDKYGWWWVYHEWNDLMVVVARLASGCQCQLTFPSLLNIPPELSVICQISLKSLVWNEPAAEIQDNTRSTAVACLALPLWFTPQTCDRLAMWRVVIQRRWIPAPRLKAALSPCVAAIVEFIWWLLSTEVGHAPASGLSAMVLWYVSR